MSKAGELDGLEDLLMQAREGSGDALGELLNGCRQYLLLTANRRLDADLRQRIGPSDVVQDTLQDAQRDFNRFYGGSEQELLAWLRRILLNNLADVGRRYRTSEKRRISCEVPWVDVLPEQLATTDETPSKMAMVRERDAALERALGQLPEVGQNVIQWRNYERLSFEAIGHRLGRSPEAARKVWVRALEQLQQTLESLDESL